MQRKRTDEVSRLSMRFAVIHPHGYWMMFKRSDLGRLREYLLIGLKRGMPWRLRQPVTGYRNEVAGW